MLFIFVGTKEKEFNNFSDPSRLKIGKTYAGEIKDSGIVLLKGIDGAFKLDWFMPKFNTIDYLVGTEIPTVGNNLYTADSPCEGGGMLKIKLSTITKVNQIDNDLYLVQTEQFNHIIYLVKVVN